MTSREQGASARRLQTLYDRQRPRLRERVLQQCQARGCPTVNHLDHVLDNQRNQLIDGADLNIVSLERQALKALGFDSGPAVEEAPMAASQPYQQAPAIDNQQSPQASEQQYGTSQQQYGTPQATQQQYDTSQQQYGTSQASQQQYGTPQQQYNPQPAQQQYNSPQQQQGVPQQQYNPPQQQQGAPQHHYTAENTGLYEQVPHHKMGGDYRTGDSGLPQPQAAPLLQTANQGQATPYGIGTRILPSKERLTRRPSRSDAEISEFQSPVTHGRRSISDSTGQSPAVVHGRRSAGQCDDSYPPAATYPPAAMPTGRISGLQGQVRSQIPLDMGHYGPLAPQHGGQLPQASGFNARAGIVDEFSVLAQRQEAQMEQRELADKMAIKEKQRQFYSDLKQQEDEKVEIQIRRQQEDQRFHHQQVQQQEQWRQQESEQTLKQQQARMLGHQARVQDLETRRYMENQARNQAIEADRM